VKDTAFLRSERGGGNDDSVKGQQGESLAVEDVQNVVERL
jgi:hypothetical protein